MTYYLIAGAGGYVGSQLAQRLLAQGERVRGIVRDAEAARVQHLAAQGMSVWTGDLTQPGSLAGVAEGVEVAFNLTAPPLLDHAQTRRLLVEGNQNFIAACSRSRALRAYVFAGNLAAYGDCGNTLLGEDTPPQPCCPLGEDTVAAEQLLLEAARRHRIPAIILRIGMIYGPGRDFISTVQNGTALLIGDGANYLAHIQIDDLLTALERIATLGQPGSVYNVADDEPTRAGEFYGALRARLGMPPPRMIRHETAHYAGLNPNIIGLAASSTRVDNQRLKHDLGLTLRYPSYTRWVDEQLGVEREVLA